MMDTLKRLIRQYFLRIAYEQVKLDLNDVQELGPEDVQYLESLITGTR